jgi:hypothetical protein
MPKHPERAGQSQVPRANSTAIHAAFYLTALLVSVILVLTGATDASRLAMLLYAGLLTLAWRTFDS